MARVFSFSFPFYVCSQRGNRQIFTRYVSSFRKDVHYTALGRRETLLSIPRTHWWKVLDQGGFIKPHFRAAKSTKFLVKQDDVVISRFLIGSRYSVRKELLSCFYLASQLKLIGPLGNDIFIVSNHMGSRNHKRRCSIVVSNITTGQ